MAETTYDREALVAVLMRHYPTATSGCECGGVGLGRSWPEHIANVYEETRDQTVPRVHTTTAEDRPTSAPSATLQCPRHDDGADR